MTCCSDPGGCYYCNPAIAAEVSKAKQAELDAANGVRAKPRAFTQEQERLRRLVRRGRGKVVR